MHSTQIALLVAACVFGGGIFGLSLNRVLPEDHLTKETQDVIKLGTNMLTVLTSLVLGLLIATANTSSGTIDRDVRAYAADLILLDSALVDYGADADGARHLLRQYTEQTVRDVWKKPGGHPDGFEDVAAGVVLEQVMKAVRVLSPESHGQRWLQEQALQTSISLLRQRWHLIEQNDRSVRPIVLAIVVSWIVTAFASFGLNAPRNATVVTFFALCAFAIGGSVFLILELDSPFTGVLRISNQPMLSAIAHMKLDPRALR